jgi:hypothetical protein
MNQCVVFADFTACGEWGAWSDCSRTCGDGMHTRSRTCTRTQGDQGNATDGATGKPLHMISHICICIDFRLEDRALHNIHLWSTDVQNMSKLRTYRYMLFKTRYVFAVVGSHEYVVFV